SHRGLAFVVVVLTGMLAVFAWREYRHVRQVLWPSVSGVGLVLFQAVLGGIVVHGDLKPILVTAHFGVAMVLVGVVVLIATNSFCFARLPGRGARVGGSDPTFSRLTLITAAATFTLLIVGTYVRATGAGLAFPDWPLMNG